MIIISFNVSIRCLTWLLIDQQRNEINAKDAANLIMRPLFIVKKKNQFFFKNGKTILM